MHRLCVRRTFLRCFTGLTQVPISFSQQKIPQARFSSKSEFSNLHSRLPIVQLPLRLRSTAPSVTMSRTGGKAGSRIVWLDLELTGLEPDGRIMEIACLVTGPDLDVIGEGVDIIVHQPDEILDSMNEWCTNQHGKTGLTEACRKSKVSTAEAEEIVLKYVKSLTPVGRCPLAGNSIHTDRIYLAKDMPSLTAHLHYRIIDVSSIKELCRRWYPGEFSRCPPKILKHRALDDIIESIAELKYYRQSIFVSEDERQQRKEQAIKESNAAEPNVKLSENP